MVGSFASLMRFGHTFENDGNPMSGSCAQRNGYVERDPDVWKFVRSGGKLQHFGIRRIHQREQTASQVAAIAYYHEVSLNQPPDVVSRAISRLLIRVEFENQLDGAKQIRPNDRATNYQRSVDRLARGANTV